MESFSYINNANPAYLDDQYRQFKADPASVDPEWKKFFEGFDFAWSSLSSNGKATPSASPDELKVYHLIQAYRRKGHLIADTNPIRKRKDRHAFLSLSDLGLSEKNLDQRFAVGAEIGMPDATLRQIVDRLKQVYCGSIGAEFMYLIEPAELEWLRSRLENGAGYHTLSIEKKKRILLKLNEAVGFEKFLHTKYIGQKRFSMEGGETCIAALDAILNRSAELGVEETVIGMAHRGRLNVLANIMGKTYEQIFTEFEGTATPDTTMGDGDVKYHLGYSSQVETSSGKIQHVKLSPNPSHLEAVDPVVEGFTRAKADLLYNSDYSRILPILIHGDASLAGQGVVYEVLQMSQLDGYLTGGSIHFVINNQIGFTTDFDDARSSDYCTSVAATVYAPVLHVNGDDPEAVVFAVELATEYRQQFHKDFFVDMVCYRRHGHNEGDDPKYTQPGLYHLIDKHKNPREVYSEQLIQRGDIDAQLAKEMDQHFWTELQNRLDEVKQKPLPYEYQEPERAWKKLHKAEEKDIETPAQTAVSQELIDRVLMGLTTYPEGFVPVKKIEQMLQQRRKMYNEEKKVDWAIGELLAYGTLLLEGNNVRLSGQDVKRGTFSHRHASIFDDQTNQEYNRLSHLDPNQKAQFRIYNSLLSEFAVLGFEFGYSWSSPETLVLWEAQFGDFSNGAQTIIDQFITAGESKWQRMSGLTLLLPHGYEGQGPEHSSARLERFLQGCAELNLQVCNISTPANFFHVLRRQLRREFRKPLIIMSPKSLLRHPRCVSPVAELSGGAFQEVIDDQAADPKKVKKLVLCSGKIYYDLLEYQEKNQRSETALVRVEQLYPLPARQLDKLLLKYKGARLAWVQEEPANMGAAAFLKMNYAPLASAQVVSRKASASPATGYGKLHAREQAEIVEQAFL